MCTVMQRLRLFFFYKFSLRSNYYCGGAVTEVMYREERGNKCLFKCVVHDVWK